MIPAHLTQWLTEQRRLGTAVRMGGGGTVDRKELDACMLVEHDGAKLIATLDLWHRDAVRLGLVSTSRGGDGRVMFAVPSWDRLFKFLRTVGG